MGKEALRMLSRVGKRLRAVLLARRFYAVFLAASGLYAALLLCSRLLALVPDVFDPLNLVTVAAASLALAVATYPRPATADVARLVDRRTGTDDLYLNASLVASSAGQYQPLVLRAAEDRAGKVEPARVVPMRVLPQAIHVLGIAGLLVAGVLLLPQLDPFGREKERQLASERERQLQEARKATVARAELLKGSKADLSADVKKALENLTRTLSALPKSDKQTSLRRLDQDRKSMGELWRKTDERKLAGSFTPGSDLQRFGEAERRRADQWQQQMQQGDASSIKDHVGGIKEKLERMENATDDAERRQLAREIKKDLSEMSDFAGENMNAEALAAAVRRAMDALETAGQSGLSQQALEALAESLDLTELELESLAQNARDLQALEEALNTAQLGRLLSELDMLDGEMCEGCQSLADYEALFKEMMKGRCPGCGGALGPGGVCGNCGGVGPGMRGSGVGVGGLAPEDDTQETDFADEKSRSALQAGKILLSIKTRDVSEVGEAHAEYREQLNQVRQGVSEAIVHEQVPPAYHEAIQRYFDSLEDIDADR